MKVEGKAAIVTGCGRPPAVGGLGAPTSCASPRTARVVVSDSDGDGAERTERVSWRRRQT